MQVVAEYNPYCSDKIKENLNRAVYRCHLQTNECELSEVY